MAETCNHHGHPLTAEPASAASRRADVARPVLRTTVLTFRGELVPQVVQHLVHLVHPVSAQAQRKPDAVNILRLGPGGQQDRRQVCGRLFKATVQQVHETGT